MKKALPTILIGFLLIALLDSIGSIASRHLSFSYGYLLPFSFLIYTAIPFFVAKRCDKKTSVISGGLLGLFDATIGWKISIMLHANSGDSNINITPPIFIIVAVIVTLTGILFGLLGWWLAVRFSVNK
ncbi:MAG TPA: hypothetical protein VKT28_11890 [Puia sp.]|nr:hypothetical protein [Puia sp.]